MSMDTSRKHLKDMEKAGLVKSVKEKGKLKWYLSESTKSLLKNPNPKLALAKIEGIDMFKAELLHELEEDNKKTDIAAKIGKKLKMNESIEKFVERNYIRAIAKVK